MANRISTEPWREPTDAEIEDVAHAILAGQKHPAVGAGVLICRFLGEGEQPQDAKLAVLLDYWRQLCRRGGGLARAADVDALDMRPALGNVMLLDVLRGGLDARYRVYGTNIARHATQDWTGWTVSDMGRSTHTPLALFYRASYLAAALDGRPLHTVTTALAWIAVKEWDRLILPLYDGEGVCCQLLAGNVPHGGPPPRPGP